MKLYQVDISPAGKEELWNYVEGAREFGDETVLELLTCFDSRVDFLEENPKGGTDRLPFLLEKYRALHLWKHYWIIYQIYEVDRIVKIEYVIDDRQNYISFIR